MSWYFVPFSLKKKKQIEVKLIRKVFSFILSLFLNVMLFIRNMECLISSMSSETHLEPLLVAKRL